MNEQPFIAGRPTGPRQVATRRELHQLIDQIPESALDGSVIIEYDDLQVMTHFLIAMSERLGAMTHEWMNRPRSL